MSNLVSDKLISSSSFNKTGFEELKMSDTYDVVKINIDSEKLNLSKTYSIIKANMDLDKLILNDTYDAIKLNIDSKDLNLNEAYDVIKANVDLEKLNPIINYNIVENTIDKDDLYDNNSSANEENVILRDKNIDNIKNKLFRLISNDVFDIGYESKSSLFFKNQLRRTPNAAKTAIKECFIENYNSSHIVYGVLSIISDIEYDDLCPDGQIITLASGSHTDEEVKEATVRVFENWCNKEALDLIENVKFNDEWLDKYRLDVIDDIRENL